jgi:hypothetical protein
LPPASFPRSFVFVFPRFAFSNRMFGTIKPVIQKPKALSWPLVFHFRVPRLIAVRQDFRV